MALRAFLREPLRGDRRATRGDGDDEIKPKRNVHRSAKGGAASVSSPLAFDRAIAEFLDNDCIAPLEARRRRNARRRRTPPPLPTPLLCRATTVPAGMWNEAAAGPVAAGKNARSSAPTPSPPFPRARRAFRSHPRWISPRVVPCARAPRRLPPPRTRAAMHVGLNGDVRPSLTCQGRVRPTTRRCADRRGGGGGYCGGLGSGAAARRGAAGAQQPAPPPSGVVAAANRRRWRGERAEWNSSAAARHGNETRLPTMMVKKGFAAERRPPAAARTRRYHTRGSQLPIRHGAGAALAGLFGVVIRRSRLWVV